jgi:hypothetical protein
MFIFTDNSYSVFFQFSGEPSLKLPKTEEEEEELLSFQLHDVAVRKGAILKGGFFYLFYVRYLTSVADPDPGSGGFLTPGSGMGRKSASGSGIRDEQPDHI